MVRLPPSSRFLAAPKNLFGLSRALESTPPLNIFPDAGWTELYALPRRVIESNKITTSFLCSTSLFAFSITIFATWTCRVGGSSKVLATTSPFTVLDISVTSSGLSSIKRTISSTSGLLLLIEWAMLWSIKVLPALGGETISPRWPFPIGAIKSIIRDERSSLDPVPCSRISLSLGKRGVKFSKRILFLVFLGSSPLIVSTWINAK